MKYAVILSNCYIELKKELLQNDVQHSCCDMKIVKFVKNTVLNTILTHGNEILTTLNQGIRLSHLGIAAKFCF